MQSPHRYEAVRGVCTTTGHPKIKLTLGLWATVITLGS